MEIRQYKIENYLRNLYLEMDERNVRSVVKFNSVRNAMVELGLVSETMMEKWEAKFKKEVKKNV